MPPRRCTSPLSLEELCVSELLNYLEKEVQFCYEVRRYQDTSLLLRRRGIDADSLQRELSSHLDVLPPLLSEIVRQKITSRLLKPPTRAHINSQAVIVALLEIVLNKEVKVLEVEDPQTSDLDIWPLVLRKCTGLQRFALGPNMFSIKGVISLQPFLSRLSSNCPMLTELVLKDAVHDSEVLATIGRWCNVLKVLDLSGSAVNCSSLIHLCVLASHLRRNESSDVPFEEVFAENLNPLCNTLEILHLGGTQVKANGAAFALKVIPNLISLGNLVFVAAGLKRLYGTKVKLKPPLKLQQAYYRGPSNIKLRVLANCCPALQTLYIGADTMRKVQSNNFASYKKLRSLTVENVHVDDIIKGLVHLRQLTELQVSSSGIDVGLVGKHCPNLEVLCITGEPVRMPTQFQEQLMFTKLQKLKLTCPISSECACLLLIQAPKLMTIELFRVRDLTDSVLAIWLNSNPLLHLETLIVHYSELTRKSVDLLLAHCPCLTHLGELGGWDIRSWECRRLKDLVLKKNYALHLGLYSRNPGSIINDILSENMSTDED